MEENKNQGMHEEEKVEYEDVKHLSMGSFIGIGFAFGVAAGFSAGNLLFGSFAWGMAICVTAGIVGGIIIGAINKRK